MHPHNKLHEAQKEAMVQWTLHELTLDKHMEQVIT
jgi:hypothetical protein